MKKVIILNNKNEILFYNAMVTTNFFERLKGVIGKSEMDENQALCIRPCNSIHMMFMKFSIDVIFLDASNRVIAMLENFKPWKVSKIIKRSKVVIEMPVYSIKMKNIKLDDTIKFQYLDQANQEK